MNKIVFNMCWSGHIPGFPMAVEYYEGCKPVEEHKAPPAGGPEGMPPEGAMPPEGMPPMEDHPPMGGPDENGNVNKQHYVLEFYEDKGETKAILTSEHGKQKVDDIVMSDFSVSFSAFAGSEGVEVFHFVLMLSESSPQCVGFAGGIKPFFRGYMPLEGVVE